MFSRTYGIVAIVAIVTFAATLPLTSSVAAKEKPIAGGADQTSALAGALGQTLFNGKVRLKVTDVRDATAAEADAMHPSDAEKVMIVSAIVRNGTHDT